MAPCSLSDDQPFTWDLLRSNPLRLVRTLISHGLHLVADRDLFPLLNIGDTKTLAESLVIRERFWV